MWDPEPSPRTPILLEHWSSEGEFAYHEGSAASFPIQQLSAADLRTPVSTGEQSFVIIPLHSPPKRVKDQDPKSTQREESLIPTESNDQHPIIISENGNQAHRRSPEKRFFSPGPICRICHEDDVDETLLAPCNCSGSLQLIHKSCLERWLSTSNSDRCEICMKQLPLRKEARPIWQWFVMTHATHGPQGFYADLTCVILLTPICLLSIYLCGIGAVDYMKHGVWEGTGLAVLSGFLMCTYIAWCYITIRFHLKTIKKWRNSNQVIHLIEKECRRSNVLRQKSVSETPRRTVITRGRRSSLPEVRIFRPNFSHDEETPPIEYSTISLESQVNPLDMSLRGFNVPAFL